MNASQPVDAWRAGCAAGAGGRRAGVPHAPEASQLGVGAPDLSSAVQAEFNRKEQSMNASQLETPVAAPEERIGMVSQSMSASYDGTPSKKNKPITAPEYRAFQRAYDFFNVELFTGLLPQVLVTLQRHARTFGYFSADRFSERTAHHRAHELALNPDGFTGRTDEEILSTLVHEQAHVWQQVYGKPGRGRYHNRQWAEKMKQVGLYPSSTGRPGGKETGSRVSHYILPAGLYATAFVKLQETGFKLHWQSSQPSKEGERSNRSKTKFTCPACGQNAWAKPDAMLGCYACGESYDVSRNPPVMVPEKK
jgi:hypothetical protein